MQELLDALEARVRQSCSIRMSTTVHGLQRFDTAEGWTLQLADGSQETFDRVMLSVPSSVAANLLRSVSPKSATAFANIPAASSAIVVTGHQLSDFRHPLDAFGLVIPHIEGRRILAVSDLPEPRLQ